MDFYIHLLTAIAVNPVKMYDNSMFVKFMINFFIVGVLTSNEVFKYPMIIGSIINAEIIIGLFSNKKYI